MTRARRPQRVTGAPGEQPHSSQESIPRLGAWLESAATAVGLRWTSPKDLRGMRETVTPGDADL